MAFQPSPAIKVELKWKHTGTDVSWRNILHVGPANAPIAQSDADLIGAAIRDGFAGANNMFLYLDAGVITDGCEVTYLGVEGEPQFSVVEPDSEAGLAAGVCLPLNVAFCVTLRTSLNTRNGRGRVYVSGISDTALTDTRVNKLDPAALGDFEATWDAVRGQIDSDTPYQLGVLSRYDGVDVDGKPIPRPAGVFTAVTSIDARDTRLDSMRSRLKQS